MSRTVMLAGLIVVVVAAGGVGWFFGSQIKSPAEVAAEAEPPPASNIAVEVVSQELSADVITRGDIVYDEPVQVLLSGSFAEQPARLIVTQAVDEGAELDEGDMVVEVVGRPVFLLTGDIPMYRDLRPGANGVDVRQLEEALARMGYFSGTVDETWDEVTGAAVAAWYESAGYRANGLSEQDEAALKAARDRVRSAELAVAESRSALSESREGASRSAILAAEGEIQAAEDALRLAELDAQWALEDASADVAAAAQALADASQDLEVAQSADPPPTANELAELQAAVVLSEAALADAERQMARVSAEQESLLAQARTRVEVAKASLTELRQGPDTSGLQRQIELANDELTAAREDLAALESELGTWLPAGELVFLDRLPVRVDRVAVARGSEITGSFVTVTGSAISLRASVSEADASHLEVGMAVQIENPEDESVVPGAIIFIAERTGTNGVPPDRIHIEIQPEELPDELIGSNVRLTIPVSSTSGEVLAVPSAALYSTADGSTLVEVEEGDGSLRPVRVRIGLAAGGLVEITPLDGAVEEGDLVVVGRADGSAPGGESAEAQG